MILFVTDGFKLAQCTEAKAWVVAYGRAMNKKYHTLMEEIFKQLEDINQQLSRPIKDLDDIRTSMSALMEIRESEIRIDMSLTPIEVCSTFVLLISTTILGIIFIVKSLWYILTTRRNREG